MSRCLPPMNCLSWLSLLLLALLSGCSAGSTGADARSYPCAREEECVSGFTCRAGVCQREGGQAEAPAQEAPSQLVFRDAAQAVETDQCSAPVVLETRTAAGEATAVKSATTVVLSAQPATGVDFFLDAACKTPTPSVTVEAGASRATFYVRGGVAQTVRLGAATAELTSASQETKLKQALNMFDGGNRDNWVMRMSAASNAWIGLDVRQGTSDPTLLTELAATPVDRDAAPWAAVHAVWKSEGQIYIQKNGMSPDLSPYLNATGSVVFDVKVDVAPRDQVNLSLHCIYPCRGEVVLTNTLRGLAGKGWRQLSVPLGCFSNMDFKKVDTAFLLWTSGPMDLTLAHVRWVMGSTGNVSCSDTVQAHVSRTQ